MNSLTTVHEVYKLIAQRDLSLTMQICKLASEAVKTAEGVEALALYEAIVDSLDSYVTELAEHGTSTLAMRNVKITEEQLRDMVEECSRAWDEAERLRSTGIISKALIDKFVGDWMMPIGQRDWINRTRRSIRYHDEPEWVPRVAANLIKNSGDQNSADNASVEDRVRKIIAEHFGWEEADVTPEKTFSLNLAEFDAELLMGLEDEFGIEITVEEAEKIISLQTAVNCVLALL